MNEEDKFKGLYYSDRLKSYIQQCSKCLRKLPLNLYARLHTSPNGYRDICIECNRLDRVTKKINSEKQISKYTWIDEVSTLSLDEARHAYAVIKNSYGIEVKPHTRNLNKAEIEAITDLRYRKWALLSYNLNEVYQWVKFKFLNPVSVRKCIACNKRSSNLMYDHILPRATHPHLVFEISNIQFLCAQCNRNKIAGVDYRDGTDIHKDFQDWIMKYMNMNIEQYLEYCLTHIAPHKDKEEAIRNITQLQSTINLKNSDPG